MPHTVFSRVLVGVLSTIMLGLVPAHAEDGYDLWLRYPAIEDGKLAGDYRRAAKYLVIPPGVGATIKAASTELVEGIKGLTGRTPEIREEVKGGGGIVMGTPQTSSFVADLDLPLEGIGSEGYIIRTVSIGRKDLTVIAGNTDVGVLYGAFHLLRLMQTQQGLADLDIRQSPAVKFRMLNHWDNLTRYVERGYSGQSIFDWHKLPDYRDPRYTDYARANASIGINAVSLTNVNANAMALTPSYLEKAAALAEEFRPYGIKVFQTARFSAPIEIGGLDTADPLNPAVQTWWQEKADEIYAYIPDFGGFLVKANSEGQPGPQDYDRNHAEGANMLADALAPHGGVVIWRAFVYSEHDPDDRAKQAYDQFVPLDGQFRDNVLIQVKNGPIDFQPREPFHTMFGAMPETPLMMEFQITKEYLGFATHLAFLAPLYEEVLDSDTYAEGAGSTVAKVVDGRLHGNELTGVAGVANIGSDRNWSGSHFDQANWYAFGRLAWNPELESEDIAREWVKMTFTRDDEAMAVIIAMMMASREAVVDYMTPLGLAHLMATGHHYGPGPWVSELGRPEWNPVYYHRADKDGIGFDRTETGSNAVSQYAAPVAEMYGSLETTPENLLLWFHHVPWTYETESGRSVWAELVHRYSRGVKQVTTLRQQWEMVKDEINPERHDQVAAFLRIQEKEAQWWRDASLAYFQSVSGLPMPEGYDPPPHDVDYYKALNFPYAPGGTR